MSTAPWGRGISCYPWRNSSRTTAMYVKVLTLIIFYAGKLSHSSLTYSTRLFFTLHLTIFLWQYFAKIVCSNCSFFLTLIFNHWLWLYGHNISVLLACLTQKTRLSSVFTQSLYLYPMFWIYSFWRESRRSEWLWIFWKSTAATY